MEGLASSREVAGYLGVKPQTMDAWAHRGHGPKHVKVGGRRRYRWADVEAYVNGAPTEKPAGPRFTCSTCGKDAAVGGYLHVPVAERLRYTRENKAYQEAKAAGDDGTPLSDLRLTYDLSPDPSRWTVVHLACVPEDESGYGYTTERINTWPKFAGFLAHVLGKRWVRDQTDIADLIRRVGAEATSA